MWQVLILKIDNILKQLIIASPFSNTVNYALSAYIYLHYVLKLVKLILYFVYK